MDSYKSYFNHIINSIIINYKSWICIGVSLYMMKTISLSLTILNFIVFMLFSHISHLSLHLKCMYPMNISHIYHHLHDNTLSHAIQAIFEFLSLMSIIIFKYILPFDLLYIDEWTVILYYLFYTSVHHINYGILKVNNVHKIHHETKIKNMGPDICDIIFNTKYKIELELENTDHYIPNIIISTIIIKIMQCLWYNKNTNKQFWLFIINMIIILLSLYLFIMSIIFYLDDINNDNNKFTERYNKIMSLICSINND